MSALTLLRPPHPIPTFVTMANAPLPGQDSGDKPVIWVKGEVEYFSHAGWTRDSHGANHLRRWRAGGEKPTGPAFGRPDDKLRETH